MVSFGRQPIEHLLTIEEDKRAVSDPPPRTTRIPKFGPDAEGVANTLNGFADRAILLGSEIEYKPVTAFAQSL